MLYRKILHQAWKTTWKNKYLWFFGLFAAFLGSGAGSEVIFRGVEQQPGIGFFSSFQRFSETGIFSFAAIKNFFSLIFKDPLSFIIISVVFLILFILAAFLFWLAVVSQTALVSNVAKDATGKKHNFKDGIEMGMNKFWPVLGLNLGYKLLVFLGLTLVGLPILIGASKLGMLTANITFVILFLLFIPVAFVLSYIVKYAICFVVIKGSDWKQALKQGKDLFVRNWLVSLEMALLLFFIMFMVGLGLLLAFFILLVPVLFIAFLLAQLTFFFGFWLVIAFFALFSILALAAIGAALSTFQISAWTSLFIQLIGKGGTSRLVRIFEKKK